jgi:hypothetical protein
MKKIVALGLSAALFLSSTSAFAFHRKPKAHLVYSPDRVLVVHKANQDLIYIPLVTPLFDQVIIPVLNGVSIAIVSGSTMVFGGVEYVLTNLAHPPHSCVARDSSLYSCQG